MTVDLGSLPTLNAILNSFSTFCLLAGYWAIRRKNTKLHERFMKSAFIFSTLFLMSYVYYHYHAGSKTFPDLGWIKTLYLFILVPHVVLAIFMVPLIFMTFIWAFKGEWTKHKKIARVTLPVWLYVSFSGVVVYLMLYKLFTPSP